MPIYQFQHRDTGDVIDVPMPMADRDAYAAAHPELERLYTQMPAIVSGVDGLRRCDEGFKDILRRIKRHNPGSTIDPR